MNELTFTFEELPLIVELGYEAGLINGSATIHYFDDGEWFVGEIYLDSHRRATETEKPTHGLFVRGKIEIERSSPLYLPVLDQLEHGRFKDAIEDEIQSALDDREIPRVDPNAEHRLTIRELV